MYTRFAYYGYPYFSGFHGHYGYHGYQLQQSSCDYDAVVTVSSAMFPIPPLPPILSTEYTYVPI